MIWFGEAKQLAEQAGGAVLKAHKTLCWFVLVGWAIYPLGYMAGTEGWYDGIANLGLNMDVIYNIGDAVNKIGFGLVVYGAAVAASSDEA
jgi:bacteriorhodopsin